MVAVVVDRKKSKIVVLACLRTVRETAIGNQGGIRFVTTIVLAVWSGAVRCTWNILAGDIAGGTDFVKVMESVLDLL